MTSTEFFAELHRRGAAIWVEGGSIRVAPKWALTPELLAAMRALKPELLTELRTKPLCPACGIPACEAQPDGWWCNVCLRRWGQSQPESRAEVQASPPLEVPICSWCHGSTQLWGDTPGWNVFKCPVDDTVVTRPKSGRTPSLPPPAWRRRYDSWPDGDREIDQAYRHLDDVYSQLPRPRPPVGDPREGELEEEINIAYARRDRVALQAALEAYVSAVIQRWAGSSREVAR